MISEQRDAFVLRIAIDDPRLHNNQSGQKLSFSILETFTGSGMPKEAIVVQWDLLHRLYLFGGKAIAGKSQFYDRRAF